MAIFGSKKGDDKALEQYQKILAEFQQKIKHHESILYGVALFFECINLMMGDNAAVMETYRKLFRNIIQSGRDCIARATALLEKVQDDPKKLPMIPQFVFTSCEAHPNPELMTQRALALTQAYDETFPGRDRTQAFTEEETMQLMRVASDKVQLT